MLSLCSLSGKGESGNKGATGGSPRCLIGKGRLQWMPLTGRKDSCSKPGEDMRDSPLHGKKGIDFCNQCDDFPCGRFQPYADQSHFPHNMKMYQLCMMKKLGFEEWAENHAARIWDTYRTVPFSFDNILY